MKICNTEIVFISCPSKDHSNPEHLQPFSHRNNLKLQFMYCFFFFFCREVQPMINKRPVNIKYHIRIKFHRSRLEIGQRRRGTVKNILPLKNGLIYFSDRYQVSNRSIPPDALSLMTSNYIYARSTLYFFNCFMVKHT